MVNTNKKQEIAVREVISMIQWDGFCKEVFWPWYRKVEAMEIPGEISCGIVALSIFPGKRSPDKNYNTRALYPSGMLKKSWTNKRNVLRNWTFTAFRGHNGRKRQPTYQEMLKAKSEKKRSEELWLLMKSSVTMHVICMCKDKCGRQSFVRLCSCRKDKLLIAVKYTKFSVYRYHTTLINFSHINWKKQFITERTIAGYLPLGMDYEEDIRKMSVIGHSYTSIS